MGKLFQLSNAKYLSPAYLVAICACLFFIGLGRLPLLEPDEGRNAEVAREMLASRDWITPHYDHLAYLDKPVLLFWMVAGAFRCFGVSEWTARFPSALLGLATVLLAWAMARHISGQELGFLAGIIVATSPLVFGFARLVIFDMALTFFVALAMFCLWLSSENNFSRLSLDAGAFAAMGLATLVKGPVGFVLPLLTFLAYHALLRKTGDLKKLHWALGWIVFFAITLPWFIAVSIRNPGFPKYAFWDESLRRFFFGFSVHRSAGPWYYIPVYLAGFFPWSFFLLFAGWHYRQRWRGVFGAPKRAELFLLTWAGVVFVFFSVSRSKLPGYFLPAIVPLSVLLARVWPGRQQDSARVPADWMTGGLAVMMLAGLLMAGAQFLPLHELAGRRNASLPPSVFSLLPSFLFLGGAMLLALGFLGRSMVTRSRRKRSSSLAFAVVAFTVPLLALRSRGLLRAYFSASSSRALAKTILTSPERDLTVYGYYYFRTSLPFYLRRPVGLVTADGDEITSNYVIARLNGARAARIRQDDAGPFVQEPLLLTARQLTALSRSAPGPFLILVQNNEADQLVKVVGSVEPLWATWRYSVWEKIPKTVTSHK
jgi:4-amino-4-deoxy-L-arabinose transferase-like glycosyltransferase